MDKPKYLVKIIILLPFFSFIFSNTSSAQYYYNWHKAYGDLGVNEGAINIVRDNDENFIISGAKTQYTWNMINALILKTDKNGNFIWQRGFSSAHENISYDVKVDSKNNIFTLHDVYNREEVLKERIQLSKYDSSGNLKWNLMLDTLVHQFQLYNHMSSAFKIFIDVDDNIFLTTTIRKFSNQKTGIIYKISNNGTILWKIEKPDFVIQDAVFSDNILFLSATNYDMPCKLYLVKTDINGNTVSEKTYVSNYYQIPISRIVIDKDKNIYSYSTHTIPEPTYNYRKNILTKLNTNGEFEWTIADSSFYLMKNSGFMFSNNNILISSIKVAYNVNINEVPVNYYAIKNFTPGGTLNWETSVPVDLSFSNKEDISLFSDKNNNIYIFGKFLAKFSSNGNYLWSKRFVEYFPNQMVNDSYSHIQTESKLWIATSIFNHTDQRYDILLSQFNEDVISNIGTLSNISDFKLHQNYPNPFNPVTKIKFSVPKSDYITLIVYDINGKEIDILVNKNLTSGDYEAEFSGENLSSGIYYYTLKTSSFAETKKMLLLK